MKPSRVKSGVAEAAEADAAATVVVAAAEAAAATVVAAVADAAATVAVAAADEIGINPRATERRSDVGKTNAHRRFFVFTLRGYVASSLPIEFPPKRPIMDKAAHGGATVV